MNKYYMQAAVLMIALCLFPLLIANAQELDATMQFYLDNTSYVFQQNYLFGKDTSFTFNLRSIYQETDYRGDIKKIDTAVFMYVINNGKIDSMVVVDSVSIDKNKPAEEFMPFLPWKEKFDYYFYPNDTGSGRMAIGFESPLEDSTRVESGLMNIDRDSFSLLSIFMHSRGMDGKSRMSYDYHFERIDGIIRPVSFEFYSVKIALLGRQYTRQILEFIDYRMEKI
ncbi:MAG: hypothetical protein AB1746_08230 [Candidatus Zixiibacteriota bacterium]